MHLAGRYHQSGFSDALQANYDRNGFNWRAFVVGISGDFRYLSLFFGHSHARVSASTYPGHVYRDLMLQRSILLPQTVATVLVVETR